MIEAAKGGHTAIVQLLLEYPKSILNCTINTTETNDNGNDNDDDDEDENLTVTMPNSFPLPSPPLNDSNAKGDDDEKSNDINSSSFTLLERLEKIVPRNILEVLKTVDVESSELHENLDTTGTHRFNTKLYDFSSNLDISTYPWPNTDRLPSPTNDETSSNNTEQAKKLYLLGKKKFFVFSLN